MSRRLRQTSRQGTLVPQIPVFDLPGLDQPDRKDLAAVQEALRVELGSVTRRSRIYKYVWLFLWLYFLWTNLTALLYVVGVLGSLDGGGLDLIGGWPLHELVSSLALGATYYYRWDCELLNHDYVWRRNVNSILSRFNLYLTGHEDVLGLSRAARKRLKQRGANNAIAAIVGGAGGIDSAGGSGGGEGSGGGGGGGGGREGKGGGGEGSADDGVTGIVVGRRGGRGS